MFLGKSIFCFILRDLSTGIVICFEIEDFDISLTMNSDCPQMSSWNWIETVCVFQQYYMKKAVFQTGCMTSVLNTHL